MDYVRLNQFKEPVSKPLVLKLQRERSRQCQQNQVWAGKPNNADKFGVKASRFQSYSEGYREIDRLRPSGTESALAEAVEWRVQTYCWVLNLPHWFCNWLIRQSNISRIENGNSSPAVATLQQIADGVGKKLHIEFR
jgi:transcriptional regulator with XRE-family HTH domain